MALGDSKVCPPRTAIQYRYLRRSGRWGMENARRCPGPRRSPPWREGSQLCSTSCHDLSSHHCHWREHLFHLTDWSPWKRRRGKAQDHPSGKQDSCILIYLSTASPEHLWAGQSDRVGRARWGDQSNWSLTRQHEPVRVLPGAQRFFRANCILLLLPAPGDRISRNPLLCLCTCPDISILV